jgi:serine/threonine-protein kinase RsbW
MRPAGTPGRRVIFEMGRPKTTDGLGEMELRLNLESTLESVDVAEAVVMRAARKAGFGGTDQHRIGLATREALVNAVAHGNRMDARKALRVGVWREGSRFGIDVEDEGTGFDSKLVPDPRQGEPLRAAHGRGLCIMRAFMDEVSVEALGVLGTRVRLQKWMPLEAA